MKSKALGSAGLIIALALYASSAFALVLGIFIALSFGNPFLQKTKLWTPKLLTYSVMGLGAGMNLHSVAKSGLEGFGYTVIGISSTLLIGHLLGRALKVSNNISILLSAGTAICGGSAIAAVSPVIRAKPEEISVSLAIVFCLNSVALMIFPSLGHFFEMSQSQFGLWSALGIHDTSSVVGAASIFGSQALETATTVKLTRALWIIPVTLFFSYQTKNSASNTKKPWFILGFIVMAATATWVPGISIYTSLIYDTSKRLLVVTLFFIGLGLNRDAIKTIGTRAFTLGVLLWITVTVFSYFLVMR